MSDGYCSLLSFSRFSFLIITLHSCGNQDSPIRKETLLRLRKRHREAERCMPEPLRPSIDTFWEHHDRWMLTAIIGLAENNLEV